MIEILILRILKMKTQKTQIMKGKIRTKDSKENREKMTVPVKI
jgi:hypothetical protein